MDCAVPPELLTIRGVESLSILEPCGNSCPKSVLMMRNLIVERISQVGSGRHMRLRLRQGHWGLNAIYFSANAETASIAPGDLVDVAFTPQINDFRGEKSVQMNVVDIRPSCAAECQPEVSAYLALRENRITPREAEPVALRFLSRGYVPFVLDYSCAPSSFPVALREAAINNDFQVVLLSEDFNPVLTIETRQRTTVDEAISRGKQIPAHCNPPYEDVSIISSWAIDGVALCTEMGILNGSNGKFLPQGNLTRAQTAAILQRLSRL